MILILMDLHRQVEQLYQQALALKTKGRLPEADRVESEAASLLESLKQQVRENPDAPETAGTLLFLAEREWAIQGDNASVQAMIEQAIRIRESRLGPEDPTLAEALGALAEFHFLAGRWGEAEPLYRRAVVLCEKGPTPQVYAKCCAGLAQTLAHLGQAPEADPFFARAIELYRDSEKDKRRLYFLYIYRAEGMEKAGRGPEAETLRTAAQNLLPRNNPGESGFHV
jgi:tetratricopeptide (TPR) repeat protein